jgi:hypothetical protein
MGTSRPPSLDYASFACLVGYLTFYDRKLAIGAAAAGLIAGVVAGNVARLAVIATAGVWLIQRVPGDISLTDVLVAAAGAAALVAGAAHTIHPRGRVVLRAFTVYLLSLTVTLLYNHNLRSDFEWFHRIALVAGAVWVGAWLVSTGLHRAALRLLLAVTTVIAAVTLVTGASTGFGSPAQPLGFQKNFIGSIVATVLLLLLAAHRKFDLRAPTLRWCVLLLIGGLVATHSRGAMIGASVGTLIWFFRSSARETPRVRSFAVLAAIGISVFTGVSIHNQLRHRTYTSFTQRTLVEQDTRRLWMKHPWTGVGLRFFKTSRYAGYQPPNNVFDEILAEAGVFGLAGFVVFIGGALYGLGRLHGDLATAGLCTVTARFVHGLFDVYWTGGTTTLAWIVAGMGLAAALVESLATSETSPLTTASIPT